jgi:hypothetical protein
MPGQSRLISNLDSVSDESDAKLLVIDPRVIVTHEAVERVCAWARGGGVVAFPRTRLYTEAARAELERQVTKNAIEIKQGAQMQVQAAGDGKIIVYDVPEAGWDLFLGSLLALSDVRSSCNVSDSRLQLVQLDRSHSGGSSGVFIMNQSSRNVAGDLIFEGEVSISDLTTTAPTHPANKEKSTAYSTRFALEVPPFGVLPVGVDGLNDAHERRIASASQGVLKAAAQEVTLNELPGFDGQKDFGASLWN